MRFIKTKVSNSLELAINKPLDISDDFKAGVDKIWALEKEKNSSIFDQEVLYFKKVQKNKVQCFHSNYRYWYAQRLIQDKPNNYLFKPLAVTGIIKKEDEVLLGKRSRNVTQEQGMYELIPSGGIEFDCGVNYLMQLEKEYQEELLANPKEINSAVPLYIIEDTVEQVVDIVLLMSVSVDLMKFDFNQKEIDEIKVINLKTKDYYNMYHKISYLSKQILNDLIKSDIV
tara:strand:+ start:3186 stop:3869 length:684 start_codon:yes stop_codon:yes gene_type:complete